VPGCSRGHGATGAIVLGHELTRAILALFAGRKARAMFAANEHRIRRARREFVLVDVSTTGDAMDVPIVVLGRNRFCLSFSLALRGPFFSPHGGPFFSRSQRRVNNNSR
jgi:hypothetical protein